MTNVLLFNAVRIAQMFGLTVVEIKMLSTENAWILVRVTLQWEVGFRLQVREEHNFLWAQAF